MTRSGKKGVLIVEDDSHYIGLYTRMLDGIECSIVGVQSAVAAMEVASRKDFAVILLDLKLPGVDGAEMGGLDLAKRLRERDQLAEIVVITAFGTLERALRVGQCGVAGILEKPIDMRELRTVVLKAIRSYDQKVTLGYRAGSVDPVVQVGVILDSFWLCADRLAKRRGQGPPLSIRSEYDVQDVLYVMLKPMFPNIVCEHVTHKHAGRSRRVDFQIPGIRTFIEVKLVRNGGHARTVAEEIKVDIESYFVDEDCSKVFFFVVDPRRLITEPSSMMADMSGYRIIKGKDVDVSVIVVPR